MRLLMVFLASTCLSHADSIRGVVINVIDGDTVTLLEKTPGQKRTCRVRLEGIDAPERGQKGYEGAKKCLEKLVWGETVTVQYTSHDKYGRILGWIWYGKTSVNEEMVKEGWAWRYRHSANRELASREADARSARKGLWSEPDPMPPWEWKAAKRGEDAVAKGAGKKFG